MTRPYVPSGSQRGETVERLRAVAAQRHLRLVRRERTRGAFVWDAIDARSGMPAARGLRLDALAAYLGDGGSRAATGRGLS
jgi:hypothetical protein